MEGGRERRRTSRFSKGDTPGPGSPDQDHNSVTKQPSGIVETLYVRVGRVAHNDDAE